MVGGGGCRGGGGERVGANGHRSGFHDITFQGREGRGVNIKDQD